MEAKSLFSHRWLKAVVALAATALLSSTVYAQAAAVRPAASDNDAAPRGRVVTMTRWVKVFYGLEHDLIDALQANDQTALDRLVAEQFEVRRANSLGQPQPRDEWLQNDLLRQAGPVQISDMAVHDHGELAVVSFQLTLQNQSKTFFIVDVWRRKAPDQFELVTRYASDVINPASTNSVYKQRQPVRRLNGKG